MTVTRLLRHRGDDGRRRVILAAGEGFRSAGDVFALPLRNPLAMAAEVPVAVRAL